MEKVLGEDLVEDILLRLPPDDPVSLLRAATVCRRWCASSPPRLPPQVRSAPPPHARLSPLDATRTPLATRPLRPRHPLPPRGSGPDCSRHGAPPPMPGS
ncbi:hypothetical protein BDA96_02G099800 [Sorghum bicolor]|uniref:F-box domain-containing protein n=1 Tax=Sorghum bicolor TaxID=4558 RepID=A0A921RNZ1_SORBI|nr:hypothetical protein BDA96_02G099800 [Sorghum bicolor]